MRVMLTTVFAMAAGAPAWAGTAGGVSDVREVLRREYSNDERTREEVVRELVELGPSSVGTFFELYTGEAFDELFGGEEIVDLERWWCPPDKFGDLFLAALGELPARRVVAWLDTHVAADAEHEDRLAALRVLAELESPEALGAVLRYGEEVGALALRYRSVQKPLEAALGRTLESDPDRVARDLEGRLADLDPELLATLATAIGRTGRPEYLRALDRMVEQDGEVGVRALEAVPELVSVAPWRFDDEPRELVRDRLNDSDWRFRRAAAFAAGRLEDTEAFGRLVLLLDENNEAVRSAAGWAVRELSGLRQDKSATGWLEWYRDEETWARERGPELQDALESGEPATVAAAVRELLLHPVFRDRSAAWLAEVLESAEPGAQLLAVGALC